MVRPTEPYRFISTLSFLAELAVVSTGLPPTQHRLASATHPRGGGADRCRRTGPAPPDCACTRPRGRGAAAAAGSATFASVLQAGTSGLSWQNSFCSAPTSTALNWRRPLAMKVGLAPIRQRLRDAEVLGQELLAVAVEALLDHRLVHAGFLGAGLPFRVARVLAAAGHVLHELVVGLVVLAGADLANVLVHFAGAVHRLQVGLGATADEVHVEGEVLAEVLRDDRWRRSTPSPRTDTATSRTTPGSSAAPCGRSSTGCNRRVVAVDLAVAVVVDLVVADLGGRIELASEAHLLPLAERVQVVLERRVAVLVLLDALVEQDGGQELEVGCAFCSSA